MNSNAFRSLKFGSLSDFAHQAIASFAEPAFLDGIKALVLSKANFLDLYTIGRVLALCEAARNEKGREILLSFGKSRKGRRLENLKALHFFDYCSTHDVQFEPTPPAESLLQAGPRPLAKYYWCPLVPITEFPFKTPQNETHALQQTNAILDAVCHSLRGTLENVVGIPYDRVLLEISHLVFGVLKELVLNVISHSSTNSVIVAIALHREGPTASRPHRAGFSVQSGQACYETLVLDLGHGVLRSVRGKLAAVPDDTLAQYNTLAPWDRQYSHLKNQEESLLSTIFRGNLVVRKGRKSEGLHELARHVGWFRGILNYRTGRTEVQLSGEASDGTSVFVRPDGQPFFLPGVAAAALLPSDQVSSFLVRHSLGHVTVPDSQRSPTLPSVQAYRTTPEGLFGGQSQVELRWKVELFAREYIEEFRHLKTASNTAPAFGALDLLLSTAANPDFIDSLLQEFCKVKAWKAEADPDIIAGSFFMNARRDLIWALRRRVCCSFLMITNSPCLMLDEADEPHFLGIPRLSDGVYDIEDALKAVFHVHSISETVFRRDWNLTPRQLEALNSILPDDDRCLLYRRTHAGETYFCAHDILTGIRSARRNSLAKLQEHVATLGPVGIAERGLADFWADPTTIIPCTKGLIETTRLTPVNTLVGFMQNGDQLAASIQRLTGASRLLIVDLENSDSWANIAPENGCAVVVDFLADGRLAGSIEAFLQSLHDAGIAAGVVVACIDMRSMPTSINGVEVRPLLSIRSGLSLPANATSMVFGTISGSPAEERLTSVPTGDSAAEIELPKRDQLQYSDIEVSAEFWHNASSLGIVSSTRSGRERRNILFYENNERIIENHRTRVFLEQFVSDVVKDKLRLGVDVVFHPSHSVGAYLAQLAASQLNRTPLVIPLTQHNYGGPIEVSQKEYDRLRAALDMHLKTSSRPVLRALIVDDSILTGSSVFTMLGIAEMLGVRVTGVMVLLNRLSPEVSAILSAMPFRFAFLYRLHMPVLKDDRSPDTVVAAWSRSMMGNVPSAYGRDWSQHILASPGESYFLSSAEAVESDRPLRHPKCDLPISEASRFRAHELRQIIEGLLLHHDPEILDISTRLAIAYNFLERLVEEEATWVLLRGLAAMAREDGRETNEAFFVRKLIYLMAFSRYTRPAGIEKTFEALCLEIISAMVSEDRWTVLPRLVSDCLMALAAVGSCVLCDIWEQLAYKLVPVVASPGAADDGAATTVLQSFAWSLGALTTIKRVELTDIYLENLSKTFETIADGGQAEIVCLDIYASLIQQDARFREYLRIQHWPDQDTFATALEGGPNSGPMMAYLKEAPGYSCTLKTVLTLCNGLTVLLYSKNASDDRYYLRAYATANRGGQQEGLSGKELSDRVFSPRIYDRMGRGHPLLSRDTCELESLSRYSSTSHAWMFGAPVRTTGHGEEYYVIVGYAHEPLDNRFIRTAYYYWLRAEGLLRSILPAIYEKHVVSSTAWNALVQSIKPIHPIRPMGDGRRRVIARALAAMNLGDLLHRAVGMTRHTTLRPIEILRSVRELENTLMLRIQTEQAEGDEKLRGVLPADPDLWPVTVLTDEYGIRNSEYCRREKRDDCDVVLGFQPSVLEFILLESLCNALANYVSSIELTVGILPSEDPAGLRRANIVVSVRNDCEHETALRKSGVAACHAAAEAVGGRYESIFDPCERRWRATLVLPAYVVPETLARRLHDLL